MATIISISSMKFWYNTSFTLQKQSLSSRSRCFGLFWKDLNDFKDLNNPKDLDLSYKMDLNFLNCFGRKKYTIFFGIRRGLLPSKPIAKI